MRKWLSRCALAVALLLAPAAHAQDEEIVYNPKVENYPNDKSVRVEDSTAALTWLLMMFLGVICVSVTFKNAKRTHLD